MSAGSLAGRGAVGTVGDMATKRRSPVIARFEIISNDPTAGESYQHAVTVQRNGRVRSVVTCVEREETVQEWTAAQPPTLEELADLLIAACRDEYHESRMRLLSTVVHGLLPRGNHLWDETVEIPDAVFDASLGFGPRTTYRVEIQRALVKTLQHKPELAWVKHIQDPATNEHDEFVGQVDAAPTYDPDWLRRSIEASASGTGTPFDNLIAWTAQDSFDTHNPATWFDLWGDSYLTVDNSWDSDWSFTAYFGRPTPNQCGTLVCAPEEPAEYTALASDAAVIDAAQAAKNAVEWRYMSGRDGDPTMRRKGRIRTDIYKKGACACVSKASCTGHCHLAEWLYRAW